MEADSRSFSLHTGSLAFRYIIQIAAFPTGINIQLEKHQLIPRESMLERQLNGDH